MPYAPNLARKCGRQPRVFLELARARTLQWVEAQARAHERRGGRHVFLGSDVVHGDGLLERDGEELGDPQEVA